MATSDSALLQQMDDYTVDGKYHEATDVYCRLVAAHPDSATHITTHGHPASPRRKDVLFEAWAHYISFYKKRTRPGSATTCTAITSAAEVVIGGIGPWRWRHGRGGPAAPAARRVERQLGRGNAVLGNGSAGPARAPAEL